MNTKRQTVWLVSMLGLMVVLSAYYLFTDEVGQSPNDTIAISEIQVDGTQVDPATGEPLAPVEDTAAVEGEEVILEDAIAGQTGELSGEPTEAVEETETAAGETGTVKDEANGEAGVIGEAATTEEAEATAEGITEEQVLQELTSKPDGSEAITAMQMQRNEQFSQEFEELTATIASGESTDEEVVEATKRHDELLDLDARLVAFEEKLISNSYSNVVVTYDEDKNHYTVNISAPSLEKSEAVSIITMALQDLKISMNQISVKLFK